ncbi:MAG: PAS domain S-box protein [Anaerolineae bacterium]|nr:PAS domain S-box protein [Anaerolineae bacterium]
MKRLKPSRSALRIAILYALVASLQILLSRWLITILVPDPDQRLLVETVEQLAFLVVVTLLLYFLVRGELRGRARTENALHTSEEQLSKNEDQQRSILDATVDGLIISDLDGRIVKANSAVCTMYGQSPDGIVGLLLPSFIQPTYHTRFEMLLGSVRAGEPLVMQAEALRQDGTSFHVEIQGSPFSYDGRPHLLAIVRDVTEHVRAQHLLERRVEERTAELTTLLRVSQQMTSTLDFEELLERVLTEMERMMEYAAAGVLVHEDGQLRTVGYHGPSSQETVARPRLSTERWGELWATLAKGETLIVGDVQADTPLAQTYRQVARHIGGDFSTVRTWMGIPLIVGGHTIGALSIEHDQPHAYTSSQAETALAIANQAAIAIENARLYRQARRLAVMEERQRLARELHDSVSQALYSIALGTQTALALLERENPVRAAKPMEYVLSLADAALAEMRALIFELRPDALEKEGLVAALSRHAEAILARHHLAVETAFCEEPSVPPDVKEALYRIAVELMNNAVKHAQATRISLWLQTQDGIITLEMHDDGVGFDPQGAYPGHLGLRSMQERAAQIGASLEIESAPGRGTQVQVRVYPPGGI